MADTQSPEITEDMERTRAGSLARSVWVFTAALTLVFALILGVSNYRNNQLSIGGVSSERQGLAQDLLADASAPSASALEAYVVVLQAVKYPDQASEYFEKFKQHKQAYLAGASKWEQADIPDELRQKIVSDAQNALTGFWAVAEDKVFGPLIESGNEDVSAALQEADVTFSEYRETIEGSRSDAANYLSAIESGIAQKKSTLDLAYASLLVIGTLLLAASMYLLITRVVRPLGEIANYTMEMANGKADDEIPYKDRDDELGDIATALTILSSASEEKLRAEQGISEERERLLKLTEEKDLERARLEQETAQAVQEIASTLKKMAKGDLLCRIENSFPGELDRLRLDLNATIDQFSGTFRKIINTSESLNTGVREMVTASDDLSVRTEKQASALEETAATVGQITETVHKSSEGAEHTRKLVDTAKTDAQVSGDVVEKALLAMREIEDSAKEINQIISVIDEIAFQTNLLALNAGVEAARAGEAGQGFAVVASEVRALAQRSATAAKEIKELISKSSEQVSGGSKLVGETGENLHRIANQVIEISSVVGEIADGAKEQHRSLNELNLTVSEMDTSTQQNAAMAEEATAACHSLKNEADELASLMASFNVGASHRSAALPIMANKPAKQFVSVPKAANTSSAPMASPAKELLSKVKGAFAKNDDLEDGNQSQSANFSGNAAIKEDDWEEF